MNRGFTLIEVLVAVGLMVITGTLILQLIVRNNGLFYDQSDKIQQGLGLNDVMMILSGDIKSASSVTTGYPVSSPTVLTNQSNLVLELPSIDSSGNTIDNTYDFLVISPDSTNQSILRQIVYPDPQSKRSADNRVLTTGLHQINFSYLDNSDNVVSPPSSTKINVSLELNAEHSSSPPAQAQAKINLRNI